MSFARTTVLLASLPLFVAAVARAEPPQTWVASWTASAHGPYPVGNPTAQPEQKFALPSAETGASDQTFRMIVRPDVWGGQARIRLSNAFGTKPVTFDGAYAQPAKQRRRSGSRNQSSGDLRGQTRRDHTTRKDGDQRSGGAALGDKS